VVEKHEQLIEDNTMNFSVNSLKSKLFGENDETRYAKIETMDSDINDAVLHCQNADIRVK
jgi:hypothetical protein